MYKFARLGDKVAMTSATLDSISVLKLRSQVATQATRDHTQPKDTTHIDVHNACTGLVLPGELRLAPPALGLGWHAYL